ncbi:helix-turn-helix transcriptional regulator [Paenibacillus ginsengihumi]|uniref:helix-turn-helix transcriptional regulator n=1 Tax=Paenibacillus ginsengihumi TaxID=431596 RepID=UPI0003600922|nr:WYL domain-containing protein [Paenibacillus ginsengihumi]
MMKRMDRLLAILIALQRRPETAQNLADKLEVSKRTILRDMQALSELGIPLYAVPGPSGGFRLMEGFQLAPLHFDVDEALTVLFALHSLTKMADTPFKQARWTAVDKIKSIMPEQMLKQLEPLLEYVEFEIPPRKVKTPYLSDLLVHAAEAHWLRVLYRSENQRRWLELLPRKIFAAHGFWYCEAWSPTHGEQRTFRVDRMESIERIDTPSNGGKRSVSGKRESGMEARQAPDVRIVARLTYRGALLAEQDYHIGECVKQVTDEAWEVDFRCPAAEWRWAVRFFFALGMDAEVIEPASLRREIGEMAAKLCERYSQQPNQAHSGEQH